MEILDAMERSYEFTGDIVAGIRPEHAGLSTPCPQFDVTALFGHLIGVLDMFTAGLTDTPYAPPTHLTLDDALGTYNASAAANLSAWRSLSDFDRMITLPFGSVPAGMSVNLNLIDVHVHGWDLAKAIGRDVSIPDELATEALAFCSQMLRPEMRSDARDASFGPEVAVAANASAGDRLVGFLGRQP